MKRKIVLFLSLLFLIFGLFAKDKSEKNKDFITIAKMTKPILQIAFSNEGEFFAVSYGSEAAIFDAGGNVVSNFLGDEVKSDIKNILFSADGKNLLCLYDEGKAFSHNFLSDNENFLSDEGKSDKIGGAVKNDNKSDAEDKSFKVNRDDISAISYYDSLYNLVLSYGDNALVENFQLMMIKDSLANELIKFSGNVVFMTSNLAYQKLLVVTDDNFAYFVDTSTWEIIETYECAFKGTDSSSFKSASSDSSGSGSAASSVPNSSNATKPATIRPAICRNGENLIIPQKNGFCLTKNGKIIKNFTESVQNFTAVAMSSNGEKIAFASSSDIHIKTVAGKTLLTYRLEDDVATSLAFSRDDDSVIVGTKNGFVYRFDFAEKLKEAETHNAAENLFGDETGENAGGEKGAAPQKIGTATKDGVSILLGYETLPKYYIGSFVLQSDYRHYFKKVIYIGADLGFGLGIPKTDWPFVYQKNDKIASSPFAYEFFVAGVFGAEAYFRKIDLSLFGELKFGFSGHFLYNNSIQDAHIGNFFPGFYAEFALGVQWRYLRLSGNIQYDYNLGLRYGGSIGVVLPILHRKK